MKTKAFFIFSFFFLIVSGSLSSIVLAKPQWLKEGLTATYKFNAYQIATRIFDVTPDGHGMSVEGMLYGNGTYSWAVRSLNGSQADVDIDVDLVFLDYDLEKNAWLTSPWNKSPSVKINVDDRETAASNGSLSRPPSTTTPSWAMTTRISATGWPTTTSSTC